MTEEKLAENLLNHLAEKSSPALQRDPTDRKQELKVLGIGSGGKIREYG